MTKGQGNDRLFNPWRAWRPWREPISGGRIDSRQGRQGRQGQKQIKGQVLYRPKLVRPNSAMESTRNPTGRRSQD
jgi:hypothetical protein